MTLTKKAKPLFKTLLSLWIVYNIFTLLVMPNVSSYIGRVTSKYITPYAGLVGLNAGWNFFSPDPAHTMYIRYTINYFDSEGNPVKDSEEGYFPQEMNKGVSSLLRKRDLYAMRFFVIEPKRLKKVLGPWLCKMHPGASGVEMEHVIETVAPLDQAVVLKDESMHDLSKEIPFLKEQISCVAGANDEVEL